MVRNHLTRSGPYLSQHAFYRLVLRYLLCFNVMLALLVGKIVVAPALRGMFG